MEKRKLKSQEEYACEIGSIVSRDVITHQNDWFGIDRKIFMQAENAKKSFILATRSTGCELLMLNGTNFSEGQINRVLGSLGNEHFYVCHPLNCIWEFSSEIRKITGVQAVAEINQSLPENWYLIETTGFSWKLVNLPKEDL